MSTDTNHLIPSSSGGLFNFDAPSLLFAERQEKASPHSQNPERAKLIFHLRQGLAEGDTPKSVLYQLDSVSKDPDEKSFYVGLLGVGQGLAAESKFAEAAGVYGILHEAIPEGMADLRTEASKRLTALQGRGELSYRLPVLLRQAKKGAMDVAMWGSMGAAQLTFGLSRWGLFKALPRFFQLSRTGRLAASNAVAFGLEGAAFVGAHHGISHALGRENLAGAASLRQEFGHAYLMMGSLRGFGFLAGALAGRQALAATAPALLRAKRTVLQQAGMLGGIAFSQAASPGLGLGEAPENPAVSSLITLLQFNVMGLGLHAVPGYRNFHQKIQWQMQDAVQRTARDFSDTLLPPPGTGTDGAILAGNGANKVLARGLDLIPLDDSIVRIGKKEGSDTTANRGTMSAPAPVIRIAETVPSSAHFDLEISRLHQAWKKEGGQITYEDRTIDPANLDEGKLQSILWSAKWPPLRRGKAKLKSNYWGDIQGVTRNVIARLNGPDQLFRAKNKDVAKAEYVLGLAIIMGRMPTRINIPEEHFKETDLDIPWHDLLWIRHQVMNAKQGESLSGEAGWKAMVNAYFSGSNERAERVVSTFLDKNLWGLRGWYSEVTSGAAKKISVPPEASTSEFAEATSEAEPAPAPQAKRSRSSISISAMPALGLNRVQGIVPPEGGAPRSSSMITEVVRGKALQEGLEEVLSSGFVLGWWSPVSRLGGHQANLLWLVPEKLPAVVFDLARDRLHWKQWFPGIYDVKPLRLDFMKGREPLESGTRLYEVGTRTPMKKVRILSLHRDINEERQVLWTSPRPAQIRGVELKVQTDETAMSEVDGSMTFAKAPSGNATLAFTHFFFRTSQKGLRADMAGAFSDPFSNERTRNQAMLSRGPAIARSLDAILHDSNWGTRDPHSLTQYTSGEYKHLKGPVDLTESLYYDDVVVIGR